MRLKHILLLLVIPVGMAALVGCTPIMPPTPGAPISPAQVPTIGATGSATSTSPAEAVEPSLDDLTTMAQEDLATRLGIERALVEVIAVSDTTWPDGSMGCPQPGVSYIQAEQPGVVIRLQAAGQIYAYHSGGGQPPFLCELMTLHAPKGNEFVPPPGSDVD